MSVNLQGLQMCRILKSAGHRVILADLRKFRFSAARFSNSVDKWVTLPDLDNSLESVENYKVNIKGAAVIIKGNGLVRVWHQAVLSQSNELVYNRQMGQSTEQVRIRSDACLLT